MGDTWRYLHHRFMRNSRRWYPFLAVYYLTYRCDFRCPYCSDGLGIPYWKQSTANEPLSNVLHVLKRIRESCHSLEITGGEPLLYSEVDQVLAALPSLRFHETILTTNGFHLDRHWDAVDANLSTLVVSVDTLEAVRFDAWAGVGAGAFEHVLGNIKRAALGRPQLVLSAVATPENIADLYAVYELSQSLGALFACYPQLCGVKVPEALRTSSAYREFMQFLVLEKNKGRGIQATSKSLEWMRDLSLFECHPFTLVAVAPSGDVYYPCLEIGHRAGNILQNSLHEIRTFGQNNFGPKPSCGNQCHSACALGFASILKHPTLLWEEGLQQWKQKQHHSRKSFTNDVHIIPIGNLTTSSMDHQ